MSFFTKQVIHDNWDDLIKDLQEDVIIDSRAILTDDEYAIIGNLDDDQQKIENFLNTIVNKSDKQLNIFIGNLQQYYPWLHEGLQVSIGRLKKIDPLYKLKTLGGIPNLPNRIIERPLLLNNLKDGLRRLNKGDNIILHGMLGCGKTTLAAAALYDTELVKTCFKGKVYWLTVGKVAEEDLEFLQQELNERFPDPVQLSSSSQLATIQLTKTLIDKGWSDCLIVLDDVKSKVVIDRFSIGAKLLVITEDKGVVGSQCESEVHYIKVDEGFSEKETLELLSKSLNARSRLPEQASLIHKYTKGHPYTVSLVASQLEKYRDSVLKDNSRWDHYVRMLSNRKYRRRSLDDLQVFYNAIQESVESLSKRYEKMFRQLAVFVEDVNIKPEVLGILWNLDKHKAEDVMVDFVRKSLAVMKWNEVQNSYVYGIHDLVSNFLKKDLSNTEEQELHRNLVYSYKAKCEGIWCQLPKNDNYIFYYIGYHLRKGGLNNVFQSLYFDLAFLEAKLQICGPADLIRDYKSYKELITDKNIELENKAAEFCTFIEYQGVSIAQGIDIIQAALQEPTTSSVHVAAVQISRKKLYLHSSPYSQVERAILPETLEIKENINIVCFGNSINEVIIVSNKKKLKLYNIRAKGVLKEFKGHTGEIRNLDVSVCRKQFLSTSFDNTIRIWSLQNEESSEGERTPSPRERQIDYLYLFNTNQTAVDTDDALEVLRHDSPLLWGVFSKEPSSLIASLGFDGTISVWDHYEKKWEFKHPSSGLRYVDFFDNFVAAGGDNEVLLHFKETGTLFQNLKYRDFISLRSLPESLGGGLVVLTKHLLTLYSNRENGNEVQYQPLEQPYKQLYSVGSHIAVSTESGHIYVFHFLNGSIVAQFPFTLSRQPTSICVNDRAMLSGYANGCLFLYPLEGLPSPLTSIKWKLDNDPVLVKMDHLKENIEVVIGKNKRVIAERSIKIKMADISRDGKVIVTACESGQVTLRSLSEQEEHNEVIIQQNAVPFKLYLLEKSSEIMITVFYKNEEALLWKEKQKKTIKLNDKRSIGCSSAHLLQLEPLDDCIITTSPMTIWSLDGVPVDCELSGIYQSINTYCVSPDYRTLVYTVKEKTWFVNSLSSEIKLNEASIKLLSFSPSSKILALFSEKGILTVLDCVTKKRLAIREISKSTTCLAVSDSGCVCFGGSNHLSIVPREIYKDLSSKIVINTRSIVAKPNGEDKFAVADNAGVIYSVYLDVINGGEDLLMDRLSLTS